MCLAGVAAAAALSPAASAGSSFGRNGSDAAAWPVAETRGVGHQSVPLAFESPIPPATPAPRAGVSPEVGDAAPRLLDAADDGFPADRTARTAGGGDGVPIDAGATLVPLPPALGAGLGLLAALVLMRVWAARPVAARHR